MAIRNDGAEPALQGRSLRAARTQCSSSEPTILQTAAVRISTALMSESGQKHELPRRSIGVRFAPNKQTPTARAQCDAMCHKRTRALQKRNLINHLVSELLKTQRHVKAERFGSPAGAWPLQPGFCYPAPLPSRKRSRCLWSQVRKSWQYFSKHNER